jgi:hypothetical protein
MVDTKDSFSASELADINLPVGSLSSGILKVLHNS